jgi:calcyclin binding protein
LSVHRLSERSKVKLDLTELRALRSTAARSNIQVLLDTEIRRLEQLVKSLSSQSTVLPKSVAKTLRTILNYSWDQTDKHVKLYVSLTEFASTFQAEQVAIDVSGNRTVSVTAGNSRLSIANLLSHLAEQGHYAKLTKSSLVVYLEKMEAGRWASLQQKDKKSPSMGDNALPNEEPKDLMNLMRKMYDEGDDQMKRTIGKAWHDSAEKNGSKDQFDPSMNFGM